MKSYDPRMHTAEHLLNQTMVRLVGCDRSFSSHIEKKKSKCDYHFTRPLTEEEERALEEQVNQVIDLHLGVQEHFLTLEEASGIYNLKRLPADSGDRIRVVTVGDYDACPCIGPHVANTAEIGRFQIISTSHEEGILRIRFRLADRLSN